MRISCRIVIPTRDSAAWIGLILDFYLSRELSPLIIIDSRTRDNTREIVASKGMTYLEFCPRADYPEAGMLEFAAQQANADWVLRLDDDELPSAALLDFVRSTGVKSKNQCYFFERRELSWESGRIVYSRSPGKYPLPDYPQSLQPMARLYHVDRIEYLEEVHTTGFKNLKLYGFAPPEAFIIHMNCLVHNFSMRVNKINAYEKIKPQVAWALADEYLPEIFESDYHNYSEDGLEEFIDILNKIATCEQPKSLTLSQSQIAYARQCVALRVKNILELRAASHGELLNADDLYWIEYVPHFMRIPLAKFLCSFSSDSLKKTGIALWDYLALHESENNDRSL